MDYEFYHDLLSDTEDLDVDERQLEIFYDDEFDIDIWASIELDAEDRKYRVVITEDGSPNSGRADYSLKLSEKKPLTIDDGYTNWRRITKTNFEGYRDTSFEVELQHQLEQELPVEFEQTQETF